MTDNKENETIKPNEKQVSKLKEIRCKTCSKKLAEQRVIGRIEIKCPRCGSMNRLTI